MLVSGSGNKGEVFKTGCVFSTWGSSGPFVFTFLFSNIFFSGFSFKMFHKGVLPSSSIQSDIYPKRTTCFVSFGGPNLRSLLVWFSFFFGIQVTCRCRTKGAKVSWRNLSQRFVQWNILTTTRLRNVAQSCATGD